MKKAVFWWMGGIVLLEFVSRLVVFYPMADAIAAITLGLIVLLVSIRRPTLALSVIAVEYVIGSMGSLLKIGDDANHHGIALRIVLFAAFMTGWFVWSVRNRTWKEWRSYLEGRRIYLWLAALLIYAFVLGWMRGNHQYLIPDANAWGVLLLLLPVIDLARHASEALKKDIGPAFIAALFWLPIKTLIVLFAFSHQLAFIDSPFYLWLRQTGVGEVTKITDFAYRIFFQSQIYAVFVVLFAFAAIRSRLKFSRWMWALLALSVGVVFISLSRSFWIGLAVGLVLIAVVVKRNWLPAIAGMAGAGLLGLALVWIVMAVPIGKTDPMAFVSLFSSRVEAGEPAALSRWQLLPIAWNKIREHPILGSGFGSAVTYQSRDPRLIERNGGWNTTYAIEWGWLEFWIKFGVFGIFLFLFLLANLIRRLWRSDLSDWFRVASVATIVALTSIHFFTPYLNHPLGFFILFAAEAVLESQKKPL